MPTDRIDFISEYCDRWCERCAFTERCSAFAVKAALAMCDGDIRAAIELAVGRPKSVDQGADTPPKWMEEMMRVQPTEAELDEIGRIEDARRQRVQEIPLVTVAGAVTTLSLEWLTINRERIETHPSPAVREALEIISWDVWLIGPKISRALCGRDEAAHGESPEDDLVQNDWNGSAKVVLISIERSAAAWRTIAHATADAGAERLSDESQLLQREVDRVFPDARRFVRPGFDT
jgi:hypothetical protein